MTRETVYFEFSSARWNYWTYCDSARVFISKRQFERMRAQGAKAVRVS